MVKETIEPEVLKMLECIERKSNFILTGGAGSGKTYSLVSLIEEIGIKYPTSQMACITYTNNAVAEIRGRITNENLLVSTIHEFIWNIISKFQIEIKKVIVDLVNDIEQKKFPKPKGLGEEESLTYDYFAQSIVSYDEYYVLRQEGESKVSHDHILLIANNLFKEYPKLCDILKDTANLIFIDEYQDTSPLVVDIFTNIINISSKDCVIGFFGDSMQAIYDEGVGDIHVDSFERINKIQNRRNPESIINLANKLRVDEIQQEPSSDSGAPNMEDGTVILGNIKFVYLDSIEEIEVLKQSSSIFMEWDFIEGGKTKELWLTQRLNADNAGFSKLYELYNNDLIYEFIQRAKKNVASEGTNPENKIFEEIAQEANISIKKRGDLLENIKINPIYSNTYNKIKIEKWNEVSKYWINKDSLLSYKLNGLSGKYEAKSNRDIILRTLDSIFELLELYQKGDYNGFLVKTKLKINDFNMKKHLNIEMGKFDNCESETIEKIYEQALALGLIKANDEFNYYISHQGAYLWERIKQIEFIEYCNSIRYQKEYLPFATQHSTKGSEYENVLVILESNWNKFNFDYMFGVGTKINEAVQLRTKKLFYVCCTRAKRNLVVVMPTNNSQIIESAKELFGQENVISSKELIS